MKSHDPETNLMLILSRDDAAWVRAQAAEDCITRQEIFRRLIRDARAAAQQQDRDTELAQRLSSTLQSFEPRLGDALRSAIRLELFQIFVAMWPKNRSIIESAMGFSQRVEAEGGRGTDGAGTERQIL